MEHFLKESPLAGMKPREFERLDDDTKKRLRKFVSQCCEKAFRRGFQQGFDSAQRGDEVVDLIRWRCLVRSDQSPSPHKNDHYTCSAIERFDLECHPQQVGLGKDRD